MIASAGGMGQQVAVPGGNMLQYAPVNGGALAALSPSVFGAAVAPAPVAAAAAPVKGGNQNQNQSKKGGEILTDLAVPALFLVSRNAVSRRNRNRSRSRISKSSRRSMRGGNQSRKHKK